MDVAASMRGDKSIHLDPYGKSLALIASRCEYRYGGFGATGFEYASIKDSIRDFGLSVREYRRDISTIGKIIVMKEEDFENILAETRLNDITAEDIRQAFKKD